MQRRRERGRVLWRGFVGVGGCVRKLPFLSRQYTKFGYLYDSVIHTSSHSKQHFDSPHSNRETEKNWFYWETSELHETMTKETERNRFYWKTSELHETMTKEKQGQEHLDE